MKFYLSFREFDAFPFGSLVYFLSGVWRKITHNLRDNKIENGLCRLIMGKSLFLRFIIYFAGEKKHDKPIKSITL